MTVTELLSHLLQLPYEDRNKYVKVDVGPIVTGTRHSKDKTLIILTTSDVI